jgi:hypothetical protein
MSHKNYPPPGFVVPSDSDSRTAARDPLFSKVPPSAPAERPDSGFSSIELSQVEKTDPAVAPSRLSEQEADALINDFQRRITFLAIGSVSAGCSVESYAVKVDAARAKLRAALLAAPASPTEPVPCGVCGGRPLASGRECVCKGIGTEQAEMQGLRETCFELEREVESLRAAAQIGADRLADAVCRLVDNGTLDARSRAGDALLDYASPGGQPDDAEVWERCPKCCRECSQLRAGDAYTCSACGHDWQRESPAPSPAPSVERQALARIVDAYDSGGLPEVVEAIEKGREAIQATRPLAEGQP